MRKKRASRALAVGLTALAALAPAACSGRGREDPILRLSAEESLAKGRELMDAGKYLQAHDYLTHAFEAEPNSVAGREALLLAADALYLAGGTENSIKAEAKYRDFQNRFPTSDRSDYVQFQIANSLARRMERPDRDQSVTRQALEAYHDLVTLFPTSEHVEQARQQVEVARNRLAEHEYLVGYFYTRFRLAPAAIRRFEGLLEDYPEYDQKDKVLYHLGLAYRLSEQPDKAAETFARLRSEYPESRYASEIPEERAR